MERIYPDENHTNQIASFIYWFYVDHLGVQPDATCYSKNTTKLKPLVKGNKNYPGVRTYTSREMADLVYYARDRGYTIRNIGVLTITGFLMSFVSGDTKEVNRIIDYLKESDGAEEDRGDWNRIEGW